jgi:hypothetical protein
MDPVTVFRLRIPFHPIAVGAAALLWGAAPRSAHAQKPSPNLHEVWSVETDSALFVAPRSIVVSGCMVWFADPRTGVWRVPCNTGGVPTQVAKLGDGPGEFSAPWLMKAFRADTVALWDPVQQRLTLFVGDSARAFPMEIPEVPFGRVLDLSLPLKDGSVRAWTSVYPATADNVVQRSYVIVAHLNGVARDSIAAFAGVQSVFYQSAEGAYGRFDTPLQRRPFVSFFQDGGFVAGRNDEAQIGVYDPSGRLTRSVNLPLPPAGTVTKADRDAYADSIKRTVERGMESQHTDDSVRVRFRAEIDRMLKNDVTFPALRQRYDLLVLDEKEQTVWVLMPGSGPGYTRTWYICALTEMSFCRTQLVPHQGSVVAVSIRGGVVYAIEQSRDGVPRIAKYDSQ